MQRPTCASGASEASRRTHVADMVVSPKRKAAAAAAASQGSSEEHVLSLKGHQGPTQHSLGQRTSTPPAPFSSYHTYPGVICRAE